MRSFPIFSGLPIFPSSPLQSSTSMLVPQSVPLGVKGRLEVLAAGAGQSVGKPGPGEQVAWRCWRECPQYKKVTLYQGLQKQQVDEAAGVVW